MNVTWVSHSAALGGAELSLEEGVRALRARGHRVDVVLPSDGPLAGLLRDHGTRVSVTRYPLWVSSGPWRTPARRAKRVIGSAAGAAMIDRLLARLQPDVVITNTLAVAAPALACRRRRIPHVWYVHEFGDDDHGLRFDLPDAVARRLLRGLATEVIADSHAVARSLATRTDAGGVGVVRYAVDGPPVQCLPPGDGPGLRLVLVGRRAPGKRQAEAVRAVGALAARGLDVELELVGSAVPDYDDALRTLVAELGIGPRVRFTPFTSSPLARIAAADVALMCSRAEAFGRVTVEAMKLGRPVVGADAAGTSELVRDGWNGLLYRPGCPDALAERIARLYADRSLLRRLGSTAQHWAAQTFTLERYGDDLATTLHRALATRRGGA